MRRPRSLVFDVGLAAVGCLMIFPFIRFLWPFGEVNEWVGWMQLAIAFAISYGFARLVDRVAIDLEEKVFHTLGYFHKGDRSTSG